MNRSACFPVILTIASLVASPLEAQRGPQEPGGKVRSTRVIVKYPDHFDLSPPLREIRPIPPSQGPERLIPDLEPPEGTTNRHVDITAPQPPPPHLLQTWQGKRLMPAPITSFEGVGEGLQNYNATVAPPDVQGDVGSDYYMHWVNVDFAIFNKADGSVAQNPAAGNTLWSNFGGLCENRNDGDPIVKYDQLAERWVVTQFAVDTDNNKYAECIAVSQTSDPTGSWYRYSYSFSDMNDYPKLAVWPDGYYISYNMFHKGFLGFSFAGAMICAYDRAAMLNGNTATSQCTTANSDYFSYLPSDLDGTTQPPSGTPNYVMALGTDQLLLWKFDVDWSTPSNTTFDGPTAINVTAFTKACEGTTRRACIPQEGTAVKLESLGGRPMFRLPYRKFGNHESLVLTHSVDVDGSGSSEVTGIRWYEIRDPGGTPTIHQSGTYSPDNHYRWMGSAAMDKDGNLAIGYSVSDGTMNPSIWYVGRLATDPLNQLPQAESIIQNGTGSQTTSSSGTALHRWGDYSSMSVDPDDDCTFWYTQEYLTADGTFNWHTRIASFKYPSCGCTSVVPSGVAAAASGNNAIEITWNAASGATEYRIYRSEISSGPYTRVATVTPPDTSYLDRDVHGGITYYYVVTTFFSISTNTWCESSYSSEVSATAQGPCDLPPEFQGISAATPDNCSIDITWTAASARCGGPVRYSIYRSTDSSFTPDLSSRIASGLTGTSHSDRDGIAVGTSYHYIVRATDDSNGQEDDNTVRDEAHTNAATDWFDDVEAYSAIADAENAGWAHGMAKGTDDWAVSSDDNHTSGGTRSFASEDVNTITDKWLITPPIDVTGSSELIFWHQYAFEEGSGSTAFDGGVLEISTDGSTWSDLGDHITTGDYTHTISSNYSNPLAGREAWSGDQNSFTEVKVDLSGYSGHAVRIRWRMGCDSSTGDGTWNIDDIKVTNVAGGGCSSAPSEVAAFTARSTSGSVKLEWMNPSGTYGSTKICRDTSSYPEPASCTPVATRSGTAGAYDSWTDTGVSNGTTYRYTAFVDNGSGYHSGGRHAWAYPFDTSGRAKWAYSSAATALAPTGVRPGAIGTGGTWAVSNDRMLHGMNPTSAGGDWPRTGTFSWAPAAMNGPAQARPPVVPTTAISGASQVIFLGSEDGHAYAVNAETGTTLWQSPALGNILLASPSGIFTDFGGANNLLFIGSRDATADNVMYMLKPADGTIITSFNNGGGTGGIGIINSAATVDYATSRIYFATRERAGGSSDTLWCLEFTGTTFTRVWSVPLGDIDGAPVLYSGRLYVGNNSGTVFAIDPTDGSTLWQYATTDGPVKGYVTPEATDTVPRKLFFSTTNRVWALTDNGTSATQAWQQTGVSGPSIPVVPYGGTALYVGSSDGKLYQLGVADGSVATSVTLGDGSATIGSPALDVINTMAYVGSESGAVYGIALPLK